MRPGFSHPVGVREGVLTRPTNDAGRSLPRRTWASPTAALLALAPSARQPAAAGPRPVAPAATPPAARAAIRRCRSTRAPPGRPRASVPGGPYTSGPQRHHPRASGPHAPRPPGRRRRPGGAPGRRPAGSGVSQTLAAPLRSPPRRRSATPGRGRALDAGAATRPITGLRPGASTRLVVDATRATPAPRVGGHHRRHQDDGTPSRLATYVDARTGKVIRREQQIQNVDGSGQSLYSGTVPSS